MAALLVLGAALLLTGCDDDRDQFLRSAWASENLNYIQQSNAGSFSQLENYELWVGRVERHDDGEIVLVNAESFEARKLERIRRASRFRHIDWPSDAYPRLSQGEYISFVAIRNLKGQLIVQTDRVAKIEKIGERLLVTPLKIKRYRQSFRNSDSPLEISAGTGQAVFAPGKPVDLTVEFANYGANAISPVGERPAEFTLELADGKTGSPIPPKSPASVRFPVPPTLGPNQTKSIKVDLGDLFTLAPDRDYTVTVSGPECKFRLAAIDFEVRNAPEKRPLVIY